MLQLDAPKSVKPEGSVEAAPSPAARFFKGKTADGTAEPEAGGFAASLEKAKKAAEAPHSRLASTQGEQAVAKPGKKIPADILKMLQELLGGIDEQQLIRVLLQISPKELLRYAETLGLEKADLLTLQASDSAPTEGPRQPSRSRIAAVLAELSELLGASKVIDAITASSNKKPSPAPPEGHNGAGAEVKNRESGETLNTRNKPVIMVLDLRKDQSAAKEAAEQPSPPKSSFTATMEKVAEVQDRDMAVLFRAPFQDRAQIPASQTGTPAARLPANFEQRFIPEVVKQTGIILKEGGNGEIRLVLKPENLGSVRIRLALSESSLEGRIVVDNNSVKELVESSLDNLRNALRLEGYQTNLEVSVGHRRSWSGNDQYQPTGWLAATSEEFDKAVPLYLDMKPDYELVNLFA